MSRCFEFVLFVALFLMVTSLEATEFMDKDVLSQSKIKKGSCKKVFQEIKQTLPKDLKKCDLEVSKIRILRVKNEFSTEEWTVQICQENRVYVIDTFHPKGYFLAVFEKSKIIEKEKKLWNAVKNDSDADTWRPAILYINEIEAGENRDGALLFRDVRK